VAVGDARQTEKVKHLERGHIKRLIYCHFYARPCLDYLAATGATTYGITTLRARTLGLPTMVVSTQHVALVTKVKIFCSETF
jgi:hypothetical protein